VVQPCVNVIPSARPTASAVVKSLDNMIRMTVKNIRKILTTEQQETIFSKKIETDKEDGSAFEEELNTLYTYLIGRDTRYVDALVQKYRLSERNFSISH